MAMRKLLFIMMMASLIGAFATAAPAWASSGQNQLTEVIGSGTLGQFGDPTVNVGAGQTPVGPQGQFTIGYPDGTFVMGTATCLFVSGNTAYLTGRIFTSGGPRQRAEGWFPGSYIIIGVEDSTVGPDLLNFSPGFAINPGCGPNGAATPVFPIVSGSYQVSGG
jgi:hypothetical protein